MGRVAMEQETGTRSLYDQLLLDIGPNLRRYTPSSPGAERTIRLLRPVGPEQVLRKDRCVPRTKRPRWSPGALALSVPLAHYRDGRVRVM
jgi:hypothetical protein